MLFSFSYRRRKSSEHQKKVYILESKSYHLFFLSFSFSFSFLSSFSFSLPFALSSHLEGQGRRQSSFKKFKSSFQKAPWVNILNVYHFNIKQVWKIFEIFINEYPRLIVYEVNEKKGRWMRMTIWNIYINLMEKNKKDKNDRLLFFQVTLPFFFFTI